VNTQSQKVVQLRKLLGGSDRDELEIGGVPVTRLASMVATPFYVYSGDLVLRQVRRVSDAIGPEADLHYSIKANPSLGLCDLIARAGAGAEVASAGELLLAQRAGFLSGRTVFAGPGKTSRELALACELGIGAVNVESSGEADRLALVATGMGRPVRMGLRINPAFPAPKSQMHMAGGAQQFGMDEESAFQVIDRYRDHKYVRLVGLHVYSGTQASDISALLLHCERIAGLGRQLADRLVRPLEMIDFGGGFAVPYFENSPGFDLETFGSGFRALTRKWRADPVLGHTRYVIELGRYLVAEAGVYITRVVDVKRTRGRRIVVTDGGMNHHITATGNFGQVFRKAYPISLVSTRHEQLGDPATVAGPCCTPLDVLAHDFNLGGVEPGDLVAVFCSGAYGYSASSLAFLSHPTPAELMVLGGNIHILREGGRTDQVLDGQMSLGVAGLPASEGARSPAQPVSAA